MDARDILIGLLTAFLLVWFVYILTFVARKLFGKRDAMEDDQGSSVQ